MTAKISSSPPSSASSDAISVRRIAVALPVRGAVVRVRTAGLRVHRAAVRIRRTVVRWNPGAVSVRGAAALLLVAASFAAAGCATNGPPEVGSRGWHELRIAEIDEAYTRGDLTTEQYLSLKNEADATRANYRAALQAPRYNYYPSPFFYPHHHWH